MSKAASDDAALPPAVRRLVWWFAVPTVATVFAGSLFAFPTVRSLMAKGGMWSGIALPLVFMLPVFVAIMGNAIGLRRIRRRLVAAEGRLCIHCVHDLRGLAEQGVCPECGRAFDVMADRRRWVRAGMLK